MSLEQSIAGALPPRDRRTLDFAIRLAIAVKRREIEFFSPPESTGEAEVVDTALDQLKAMGRVYNRLFPRSREEAHAAC